MTTMLLVLAALSGATTVSQSGPPPGPAEPFGAPWTMLLGAWTGEGEGQPGAGGGAATFELDLERHVMVRRSSSDYPAAEGRPATHHQDLMIIYPSSGESPRSRAIYFDNEGHVIEYRASWSADGQALTFESAPGPGVPAFRLTYRVLAADRLAVAFEIAPPGAAAFRPYVSGVMRRSGSGPGR